MKYSSVFGALLLIASVMSHAAEGDWHVKKQAGGITISQQATDSGFAITRGSLVVDSSADALITLIRDNSVCKRWLFSCKKSQLIKQYDTDKRLDYLVFDSPLLFSDRDMYVHTDFSFDPATQTAMLRMSGRQAHDKGQAGRVRIKDLAGFWRLQKLPNNKTSVLYQVYTNPQLTPSRFLNNHFADSVFHSLKNLAVVSKEAKYSNVQMVEMK